MCASGDFAVCFLLKQTNTSQVKCHELKTARSQERGAKSNECTSKLIFVVNCTNRERTNKLAVRAKEFKSRKGEEPSRDPERVITIAQARCSRAFETKEGQVYVYKRAGEITNQIINKQQK